MMLSRANSLDNNYQFRITSTAVTHNPANEQGRIWIF